MIRRYLSDLTATSGLAAAAFLSIAVGTAAMPQEVEARGLLLRGGAIPAPYKVKPPVVISPGPRTIRPGSAPRSGSNEGRLGGSSGLNKGQLAIGNPSQKQLQNLFNNSSGVRGNPRPPSQLSDRTKQGVWYKKSDRDAGVRDAWKAEQRLVLDTGRGTRNWTPRELHEIRTTGRAEGYVGHHVNSVHVRPDLARVPANVRFVPERVHQRFHSRFGHNNTGMLVNRDAMRADYQGQQLKKGEP